MEYIIILFLMILLSFGLHKMKKISDESRKKMIKEIEDSEKLS
jgi:hypothetical protein